VYDRGIGRGATVEQGQQIGRISAPGESGYMSVPHVEIDVWKLHGDGSHSPMPFVGEHALGGQEYPDVGGSNQHMGLQVSA
jgi:hypothetical protein